MKKTVTVMLAVAFGAFIAQAQTTSDNVVGYSKVSTPAPGGFSIVNIAAFSSSDSVALQDAVQNESELNASAVWDNADKIIVWNGSGYSTYGLYDSGSDTFWMAAGIGWSVPMFASAANVNISRGSAVWIQTAASGSSSEAIVAGEVYADSSYGVSVVTGFSMVAFPFTSAVNLNALTVDGATASAVWENADKIIVWNGSGYSTYGYYAGGSGNFWMAAGIGWSVPMFASPADASLSLGSGFWYESDSDKTITFTSNYSL